MEIMKYQLQDFQNILFDGFDFKLPEETVHLISVLALEVGSPTYIKTPIFKKREGGRIPLPIGIQDSNYKKKRSNKPLEIVNDEDWESLRSFHTTKMEKKVGIDIKIDLIRSHLNKMSDKNFIELKGKIVGEMNELIEDDENADNLMSVSRAIFEFASTNRFYSKLYADLYSDLVKQYTFMKTVFDRSFANFMELFDHIDYVDPDKDYDMFCKNNKDNEKRKAMSAFLVNLTLNEVIQPEDLIHIIFKLMNQVLDFIHLENKKNIVDELTENIAILCGQKHLLDHGGQPIMVRDGKTIDEVIGELANSKSKTFPSLSNKSIFKYMDMIDM